jgi:hypothetical protein
LLRRFVVGAGGALTGLTTASGRKVEPGPVSWDGSGALRGSRRYSKAWKIVSR